MPENTVLNPFHNGQFNNQFISLFCLYTEWVLIFNTIVTSVQTYSEYDYHIFLAITGTAYYPHPLNFAPKNNFVTRLPALSDNQRVNSSPGLRRLWTELALKSKQIKLISNKIIS